MGSPYLPTVRWEAGFSTPFTGTALQLSDAYQGILGTNTLGTDDLWVDISPYVRSWSTRRGASRQAGVNLRYEAGICTVELNNADRRFDPTNLAGPYVSAGASQVGPMVRIRALATWGTSTWPLFYGYADDWRIEYQPPSWSRATLTATDAFKVFASYDRLASAPTGAGETSGARIGRILTSISWPTENRLVATGDTSVKDTTLADNVLTELLLVQDTELGEFYMDAAGRAVFRNRQATYTDTRSTTAQAVFGDGGIGLGELPYADVKLTSDDTGLANTITISRAGGTAQTVIDATSVAKYLTKTYQRLDLLMQTDPEALDYANALLYQGSTAETRFTSLVLRTPRPNVASSLWPQMLGRVFGDRITVKRRPPGGGATISRDAFIRGVEHTSDGETWQTTFQLQSATRFAFFVLGDANLGVLGANALGY